MHSHPRVHFFVDIESDMQDMSINNIAYRIIGPKKYAYFMHPIKK